MAYNESQLKNNFKGTLATNITSGNISSFTVMSEDQINVVNIPFFDLHGIEAVSNQGKKLKELNSDLEKLKVGSQKYNELLYAINSFKKSGRLPEKIERTNPGYAIYSLYNLVNSFNGSNYAKTRTISVDDGEFKEFAQDNSEKAITNWRLRMGSISKSLFETDSIGSYARATGATNVKEFNRNYGIAIITDEGNIKDGAYIYGERYKALLKDDKVFKENETKYFNLINSKEKLTEEQLKEKRELEKYFNKQKKNLGQSKTFAFLYKEDGTFSVNEAKVNYTLKVAENGKQFAPDYQVYEISPMGNTSISMITDTPILPGYTAIDDFSTGLSRTPNSSPSTTIMQQLIREVALNKTMNLAADEEGLVAKSAYLSEREKYRSVIRIFEDSHTFNLGESADANWTNIFQLKLPKYDATQSGPKNEVNQYLLTPKQFKNLFLPDDGGKEIEFFMRNKISPKIKNVSMINDYEKSFYNSMFSVSIDSKDQITGLTILNKGFGDVSSSTRGVVHLDLKKDSLIDSMNSLNTKAMTIKLKSREELIKRFAYAELQGEYSKKKFNPNKGIINNSIDYYNSKLAEVGSIGATPFSDKQQFNLFQLFYANDIEDVDAFHNGGYNFLEKKLKNEKKKLEAFDDLVQITEKDLNYGFIKREEIELYTGVKFNPNNESQDPTSYLKMVLDGEFNLDPRLRKRIESQLEYVNENSIRAFYATGENVYLAGNVGKQGANAAGKLNFLETFNHPLAFIDTNSQRKSQGVDDFGALSIGGINVNRITGNAFSEMSGASYHDTYIVNRTKIGIRESLEKLYVNNYLTKSMPSKEYQEYLTNPKSDKFSSLNEALKFQINGLRANDQYSSPIKLLHANTEGSWQDSNFLADTAKMKTVNSPDMSKNIKIDINNINYNRIQKLDGTYYSNKIEFLDDWKYNSLSNGQKNLEDVTFDDQTKFGNIMKQILGDDYDKIKLHRTNATSITDNLQIAADDFKLDVMTGAGSLEAEAEAINKYKKIHRQILEDNLITFKHGKGSIGNKEIIGNSGMVNKANMAYVSGIDVVDNIINLQVQKVVLGGSGGKAMIDSVKLTENGMNTSMMLFELDGKDIRIDGLTNPKAGKLKRGFNGFSLNAIMNTMAINAATTPLYGEERNNTPEILSKRLSSLQKNIFDAPIIEMAQTETKGLKQVTLSDLFGLEYSVDKSTGMIDVRSKYYDEAYEEFEKQLRRSGGAFLSVSLENIVAQKFYNRAKELGLDMSGMQMEAFSPYLLERLEQVYEGYVDNYMDKEFSHNARIFLRGSGAIKTSVIDGTGKAEFRVAERTQKGLSLLLYHHFNGMDDSIAQKDSSALLSSTSFLNIVRQQRMNELESVLMEKSTLVTDVEEYWNVKERFTGKQKGLGLHNLIDYRAYTIDGIEINKYQKYADSKILKEDFVTGEYFLSDILDFDERGTKHPIRIFGTLSEADSLGKAINMGSSVSEENRRMNAELMNIIKKKFFTAKNDKFNVLTESDFTDEQLIALNSHIKTFLKDGNKKEFLKNYTSDLVKFHGINVKEDLWLKRDYEAKDDYVLNALNSRKAIEGHLNDLEQYGFKALNLSKEEEKEFYNLLGTRVNFLAKLSGSEKKFAGASKKGSDLTKDVYGKNYNFIRNIIDNGFTQKVIDAHDETFFFDLNRVTVGDDGRFVFNSNFEALNKFAKTVKEYKSMLHASELLNNEQFVGMIKGRKIGDADGVKIYSEIFNGGKASDDIGSAFIQLNRNKLLNYKTKDLRFHEFMGERFSYINEGYTNAQTIKTRDLDGKLLITDGINKILSNSLDKYTENGKEIKAYTNPFKLLKDIERELEGYDVLRKTNKDANDKYEIFSQIKKEIQTEYLDKILKNRISMSIATGTATDNFIDEMFNMFSSNDFVSEKNKINAKVSYYEKELASFANSSEINILKAFETFGKEDDTKYINSLNVTPSEGTMLNKMFTNWIDGSNSSTTGQTKGAASLFFKADGAFRESDDFEKEYKNFSKLGKRIYGDHISFEDVKKSIEEAREMIANGATPEEVKRHLSKFTETLTPELDSIVGLTLISSDNFKKITRDMPTNDIFERGTAYIQLVRNPTIYHTSILPTKLVSISPKDIELNTFLSGMLGNGSFDDVDRITTFNIGKLTQLVMNGDYDGDKIYAALVGARDSADRSKLLKVYSETLVQNAIMNEITRNRNPFDAFDGYVYNSKSNNLKENQLWYAFDKLLGNNEDYYYLRNMGDKERVEELKKSFSFKVYGFRNGLNLMMTKYQDELDDASKTLHIPEFKVETDSGIKLASNSLMFKLFNLIQGNERGAILELDSDRLKQRFEEAKGYSSFYNMLNDDDKKALDAFIDDPEKAKDIYKTIFEDKNKNKTLRLMLSQFGELTNFRSYADNAKTGTASFELASVGRLARYLSDEKGYQDFKRQMNGVTDDAYNFSISQEDFLESIKRLSFADLFAVLPEKAISSKHDTDTAEALITSHKIIKNTLSEMLEIGNDTKIFKDASDYYTKIVEANTIEDLKKLNFIDYLKTFGVLGFTENTMENKRLILKHLLNLGGLYDGEETQKVLELFSHDNDLTMDQIVALFSKDREAFLNTTGNIDMIVKDNALMHFGHLNEIILENFNSRYLNAIDALVEEDGIKAYTVKSLFRNLEENAHEKFLAVTGQEGIVKFHGVINGWTEWLKRIKTIKEQKESGEYQNKVEVEKNSKKEAAKKLDADAQENKTNRFNKMATEDIENAKFADNKTQNVQTNSADEVKEPSKAKDSSTENQKFKQEKIPGMDNTTTESDVQKNTTTGKGKSDTSGNITKDEEHLTENVKKVVENVDAKTEDELGEEIIIRGSSVYKKYETSYETDSFIYKRDLDLELKKRSKEIKDSYKEKKSKTKNKAEKEKLKASEKKELEELEKQYEEDLKKGKSVILGRYRDEVNEEYQKKLDEDKAKIAKWRDKGKDPIEKLQEEIHEEKLEKKRESIKNRNDFSDKQRHAYMIQYGKDIKESDKIEAETRVYNADHDIIQKSYIDMSEEDYNANIIERNNKILSKNAEGIAETVVEGENTAKKVVKQEMTILDMLEKYETTTGKEKSKMGQKIRNALGDEAKNIKQTLNEKDITIDDLTKENSELKKQIDDLKEAASKATNTVKETVENTTETVNETVNNKTTENVAEATQEAVQKGKTVVDDTMKSAAKAATEAGETIKEAFKGKKAKTGLAVGIGAALIGGFVSLLNRNRTVVHLEMNEQMNQQPQQGGGYGVIAPTDNLQRRMGNYKIYTNVRDTF